MGLLFFDRNKDGNQTLLNSKMSPDDLKRSIKLEEHVSIYEDFLASGEAGDGTYGYRGEWTGGGMTMAKDTLGGGISEAARVARVNARMNNGEPPLLVSIDPKTGIKIFAEEDKDAFEHGYICENCVQYQAVPNAPQCNWANNPTDGCGFQNY